MESAQLVVYNYLASKAKAHTYSTLSALSYDVRNNLADSRFIPEFAYAVMDISTKKIVSTLWTARNRLEWVKVADGEVTEHYRRFPNNPQCMFKNLDIHTGEVFEHYEYRNNKSIKIDEKTGEELGFTTFSDYASLPEEYKTQLQDYSDKESIFAWSDREYGKIVYISKNS